MLSSPDISLTIFSSEINEANTNIRILFNLQIVKEASPLLSTLLLDNEFIVFSIHQNCYICDKVDILYPYGFSGDHDYYSNNLTNNFTGECFKLPYTLTYELGEKGEEFNYTFKWSSNPVYEGHTLNDSKAYSYIYRYAIPLQKTFILTQNISGGYDISLNENVSDTILRQLDSNNFELNINLLDIYPVGNTITKDVAYNYSYFMPDNEIYSVNAISLSDWNNALFDGTFYNDLYLTCEIGYSPNASLFYTNGNPDKLTAFVSPPNLLFYGTPILYCFGDEEPSFEHINTFHFNGKSEDTGIMNYFDIGDNCFKDGRPCKYDERRKSVENSTTPEFYPFNKHEIYRVTVQMKSNGKWSSAIWCWGTTVSGGISNVPTQHDIGFKEHTNDANSWWYYVSTYNYYYCIYWIINGVIYGGKYTNQYGDIFKKYACFNKNTPIKITVQTIFGNTQTFETSYKEIGNGLVWWTGIYNFNKIW